MRKFLAALCLAGTAALVILLPLKMSFQDAAAAVDSPRWKSADLMIRTRTITGDPNNQGYIDSSAVTLGLKATIDTTVAWNPPDWSQPGNTLAGAESLSVIAVQIICQNELTSGESLYIAPECGIGEGGTFTSTLPGTSSPGTSRAGGFDSGACIVAGTNTTTGYVLFNGWHPAAATSNGVKSPLQFNRNSVYGGWYGCPSLRFKILSTIATDNVLNKYHVRVWYWGTD